MDRILNWLLTMALVAVVLIGVGWLGHAVGTKAARKYPSLAMSLFLINNLLRVDPPPPPTMETIREADEEESAADPPKT